MKIGAENRRNLVIMLVLLVIALISVWHWIGSSAPSSAASANAPATTPATSINARSNSYGRVLTKKHSSNKNQPSAIASLDPTLRFDLLRSSENREYTGGKRNIFEAESIVIPTPIVPIKPPTTVANSGPPPPPPPPPINLKFYGFATPTGESKRIFLAQGEDVFIAKEGDIVDRRYKVVRISQNAVEILDVLSNNRQSIPLTQG